MEAFLNKKYKLTKSENFDEFLRATGVGLVTRKMVGLLTPVVELKKEGDVYTLLSVSAFRSMPMSFKIGEEFEEAKPDGRKFKTIFTIEGNKLIQVQNVEGKDLTVVREFTDQTLTAVMTFDTVVCTRVHTAVVD